MMQAVEIDGGLLKRASARLTRDREVVYMCVCVYIYIYIYDTHISIHMCIHVCIYIYIEREREGDIRCLSYVIRHVYLYIAFTRRTLR